MIRYGLMLLNLALVAVILVLGAALVMNRDRKSVV